MYICLHSNLQCKKGKCEKYDRSKNATRPPSEMRASESSNQNKAKRKGEEGVCEGEDSGYAIFATSNLEGLFGGMMTLHRHKLDHERALLPHEVAPLLAPVLALREHF